MKRPDMEKRTIILTHTDILLKIERMAWQILEANHGKKELVLIGLMNKGYQVALLLKEKLEAISTVTLHLGSIYINKDDPNDGSVEIKDVPSLSDKDVLLIDDVLNSGKTLMYATLPILNQGPASLHTVVLANRAHTSFPIKANIVGISLATTLQEHITFVPSDSGSMEVYLS
ncbi:MAG: phosphoribosyltransferase [Flavobacteriales bacterium]|nr:phosphoribosyltransferase [Flavobacteriales bacterium]